MVGRENLWRIHLVTAKTNSLKASPLHELNAGEIDRILDAMATDLREKLSTAEGPILFVGIANGGIPISRELGARMGRMTKRNFPVGVVDCSFHRDDIGEQPIPKEVTPTDIRTALDGATVVLVDDVLESGRTARAALNEIFDLGRPVSVILAVVIDRGGRRLPIQPDVVGRACSIEAGKKVKLRQTSSGTFEILVQENAR